jgi:hypothetical protein
MVRRLLMALAATAAVTAGSTMTASAMHGWHGRAGFAARPFGFHEHRLGFHYFPSFRDRFAFYGVAYTEDCFAPIWTPWGWRWRYLCY